jgi:hypothetical protein
MLQVTLLFDVPETAEENWRVLPLMSVALAGEMLTEMGWGTVDEATADTSAETGPRVKRFTAATTK